MGLNEKLFKALSNQTRLDILRWLKDPENEITSVPRETVKFMMSKKGGICVGDIVIKSGLAQSTISKYLNELHEVDLLISERHGKWTYYRRNEKTIQQLSESIKEDL